MPREQHPVPEHVAGHAADADDREVLRLRVAPHLAEMALDGFPGAARRDAHPLVVVSFGAARGERVSQPETVVARHPVGDVRERRGALVGGHDEIGIVAVEPDDVPRRNDLAVDLVVHEVEEPADQGPVAFDGLGVDGLAAPRRRRALDHEPALGAHGHDHGVLHHLRLHQAQDLGAEILRPVGPAQPAPRHLPSAQVYGLDPRRVDERFHEGPGQGQFVDGPAVDLEGDVGLRAAVGGGLEEVRPQDAAGQVQEPPENPILVQVGDGVEGRFDLLRERDLVARRALAVARVEPGPEQARDVAGDAGVPGERALHVRLAEGDSRLPQILAERAQDDDVPPLQPGPRDQTIESVVLDLAVPDARERLLKLVPDAARTKFDAGRRLQTEIVDPDRRVAVRGLDLEGTLLDDPEAHVLQHGKGVRQRQRPATMEELEPQRVPGRLVRPIQVHADAAGGKDILHLLDVERGLAGGERLRVAGRKRGPVLAPEQIAALLAEPLVQLVAEILFPGPRHGAEKLLQLLAGRVRPFRLLGGDDVLDSRERHVPDVNEGHRYVAVERPGDRLPDALGEPGAVPLRRDVDQARDVAPERIAPREDADSRTLVNLEDADGRVVKPSFRDLEQLVAREGVEDVDERLPVVARSGEARHLDRPPDLAPEEGDPRRGLVVGGGGEKTDEPALSDDLARPVEGLDPDVVHVDGAMHGGADVGLGEDDGLGTAQEMPDLKRQLRRTPPWCPQDTEARIAQHAEPRPRDRLVGGAFGRRFVGVFAIAEKGEMVVGQPLEERDRLIGLVRRDRRRVRLQVGDGHVHPRPHGTPVLHRASNVGEDPPDRFGDLVERLRRRPRADLDVHVGFADEPGRIGSRLRAGDLLQPAPGVAPDPHDGMDHRMDGVTLAVEAGGDRIDEERHVVVDDLDDRMRAPPSVPGRARIEDTDLGSAGFPPFREVPEAEGRAAEIFHRPLRQVGLRRPSVEQAGEPLHGRGPLPVGARPQVLDDPFEAFRPEIARLVQHRALHAAGAKTPRLRPTE